MEWCELFNGGPERPPAGSNDIASELNGINDICTGLSSGTYVARCRK